MQGALNTFVVCQKKSMYLDTHVVDSTCADVKLIITACNLPLHKIANLYQLINFIPENAVSWVLFAICYNFCYYFGCY